MKDIYSIIRSKGSILTITLLSVLFSACDSEVAEGRNVSGNINKIALVEGENFAVTATRIDSFFSNRFERGLFNGTVLFSEDGRIIFQKAFGYSNFRTKDSLSLDSRFQLASVSKPLTAYAIMLLHQRGALSYEDSVQKFFPDFPYRGITLHMLLSHRSGLPNYMYFAEEFWKDKSIPIHNTDVLNIMIEEQPKIYYLPDRRYNYSNTNYCILALIIEEVSGLTYEDFMTREIFRPLGMDNTFVYRKTESNGYDYAVDGYTSRRRRAEDTYLNGVVGDKGIYSSVIDLHKFDTALQNGTLVDTTELNIAYSLAHKDLYDHDNYGYGWRINKKPNGDKIVYHSGWWKGFRSYLLRDLRQKKTVILLTNISRTGLYSISELCGLFDISTD